MTGRPALGGEAIQTIPAGGWASALRLEAIAALRLLDLDRNGADRSVLVPAQFRFTHSNPQSGDGWEVLVSVTAAGVGVSEQRLRTQRGGDGDGR